MSQNKWEIQSLHMITSSTLLEHLEPAVFALTITAIIAFLPNCLHYAFGDLLEPYYPYPRIQFEAHIAPHIAPLVRRLDQAERTVHAWSEWYLGRNMSIRNPSGSSYFETPIKPLTTFANPCNTQDKSSLFYLPTEILDLIVTYALTPHQDLLRPYPFSTCYRRPGHLAPSKTSTSLLQTCQAIYSTHWYLPWTLSSHTFYLTSADRCPPTTTTIESMMRTSYLIENLHPDAPPRRKQVSHIQVFAQLWALEGNHGLTRILSIPHFNPRVVTITIRHTDWWFWESDDPLHFMGTNFVRNLRFPASVEVVNLEFESLERKKAQIEWMARYATNSWHFTRIDEVHLAATTDSPTSTVSSNHVRARWEVTQWKGSATWGGERWIRDEDDKEPNVLSYYVATIPFRAVRLVDDPEGYKQRYEQEKRLGPRLEVDGRIGEAVRMRGDTNALYTHELQRAGILGEEDEETGELEELESICASEALKKVRAAQRQEEYEAYDTGNLLDG